LELGTDETGFGLLPTPTTQEVEHPKAVLSKTGRRMNSNGTSHSLNLADTVKMFPTPTAQDFKRRGPNSQQQGLSSMGNKTIGRLNPQWVEWLMGFPIGWTELKPSEMPLSRKSPKSSGKQ
jgi:hypothetical protein